MSMETTLGEIGFTKVEIKVYFQLLKLGKCKADEIIKKTGIYKSNVYHALYSLIKKGFIGEITINNVRHFEAYGLEKVFDVLDERKREIDKQKENIKSTIENVQKQELVKESEKINLYSGNGVKTILYDILKTLKKGDTIYSIGSRGDIMFEFFEYYFLAFIKQRVEKGIKFKGIFASDDRKKYQEKIPKLTEAKFLNREDFSPMQIMIYENKVAIFLVGIEMQVVLIENKNFAKNYINYFNYLWDSIRTKPINKR